MKPSIIICSYGRPEQLKSCLASIPAAEVNALGGELILISAAEDLKTGEVMNEFAAFASYPVKVGNSPKRGLSRQRNFGLPMASGQLLFFTDDDCLMTPGYLSKVVQEMSSGPYAYGGAGLHDQTLHAPGKSQIGVRAQLPPGTLVGAGIIPGAAMFFRKEVFEKIGNFREDMGAGADMPFGGAEDLEIAARASLAGYTGLLIPDAMIIHQHHRPLGGEESAKVFRGYDLGRGTHYAWLMMHGVQEAWAIWAKSSQPGADGKLSRSTLQRMANEFEGAAKYLAYCLENNIDLLAPEENPKKVAG